MPISTNPNATATFWLESDAEVPLKERPVFLVKFLTQAEHEAHQALMEQAVAAADNREAAELLIKAVRVGVVGWKNFHGPDGVPLEFGDQAFFDMLIDRERWEVAWQYPAAVRMTKVDMGESERAARSAPARPAPTARAASARSSTTKATR